MMEMHNDNNYYAGVDLLRVHQDKAAEHFDQAPEDSSWSGRQYKTLLAYYYRLMIPSSASVLEVGCGNGELLALLPNQVVAGVDVSARQVARAKRRLPQGTLWQQAGEDLDVARNYDYIIISDTLNYAGDVQKLLQRARVAAHAKTRMVINFYNPLWRPVITLFTWLGLAPVNPPCSWINSDDMHNLLKLSEWELIKEQARILVPFNFPVVGPFINRWLAPILAWLCLTRFQVARPMLGGRGSMSVSVVIPARNESGNIEAAVRRCPDLGLWTELIFVEGHSTDNTWEEIQRCVEAFPERRITAIKQSGRGKGNAVREAFARATGDIVMILDADLTMPPEELSKFYRALESGHADMANGVRLVYPIEDQAMQFLNLIANRFFGMAFTWLLGQRIKDTLCGTKAILRTDYEQISANRAYFGEFDPFGDFDLLFGADRLNFKIVDIPIRYRSRTYGQTNINRWSHGFLLFRMLFYAARKLKFI